MAILAVNLPCNSKMLLSHRQFTSAAQHLNNLSDSFHLLATKLPLFHLSMLFVPFPSLLTCSFALVIERNNQQDSLIYNPFIAPMLCCFAFGRNSFLLLCKAYVSPKPYRLEHQTEMTDH